MKNALNFQIKSSESISQEFVKLNILSFEAATLFVREIPYGRNKNKHDLTTVFTDYSGTCSTKHGLLKVLADENKINGLELILGLFKMNSGNTPKIANTLQKNRLEYIPEAHNYLRYNNQILDYTTPKSEPSDFIADLIEEHIIQPNQITEYKVAYHKNYLKKWLIENKMTYSLEDIWTIREECIKNLSE